MLTRYRVHGRLCTGINELPTLRYVSRLQKQREKPYFGSIEDLFRLTQPLSGLGSSVLIIPEIQL